MRKPEQFDEIDGLVIPGGESTTFLKLLGQDTFRKLDDFVHRKPTFGTCAGAILLAKQVENPHQPGLNALDITIRRNGYGRQIDSTIVEAASYSRRRSSGDGLHSRAADRKRWRRRRSPGETRRRSRAGAEGKCDGRNFPSGVVGRYARARGVSEAGEERNEVTARALTEIPPCLSVSSVVKTHCSPVII